MAGKKITKEIEKQLMTAPAEVVKNMNFKQISDATFKKPGNTEPHKDSVLYKGKTTLPLKKTKDGKTKIDASNKDVAELMKTASKVKGMVDTINFDALGDDINAFNKNISSFYGGWRSKAEMDENISSVKKMKDRISAYEEYRKKYTKADLSDLSELETAYDGILKNLEHNSSLFANYSNAEEFEEENGILNGLYSLSSKEIEDKMNDSDRLNKVNSVYDTAKEYKKEIERLRNSSGLEEKYPSPIVGAPSTQDLIKEKEKELRDFLKKEGYNSFEELENARNGVAYTTVDGYKIKWEELHYDAQKREYETQIDKTVDVEKHGKYEKKDVKYTYTATSTGTYGSVDNEEMYLYNLINGDKEAIDYATLCNINMSGTYDNIKYEHFTEDEKRKFNAIEKIHGIKKALEYAEFLSSELRRRRIAHEQEFYSEEAKKSPVGASVVSVLDNLGNNALALPFLAMDYVEDGSIDENSSLYTGRRRVNTERSTVENEVIDSAAGKFFYRSGMNIADNLAARAVSLGMGTGVVSQFLMSSGAAVDTVLDAKERGLSDGQALSLGAISGFAEGFFEGKGFEAWVDKKTLTKGAWQYFTNSLKTELVGEVFTEGTNDIADIFIAQDLNKLNVEYQSYLADGLSEKKAFLKVVGGVASRYAELAAATILSAGVMSGPGAIAGGITQNSYNKSKGKNIINNKQVNGVLDVISEADTPSAYEVLTQFNKKGVNAENITDAQLGKLYTNAMLDAQEVIDSKASTTEQKKVAEGIIASLQVYAQDKNARTAENAEMIKTARETTEKVNTPLPQGIVEGNKTTDALYRDASLGNISLQLAKMGYLEADLKDVAQTLVNYAKGEISITEVEKILSIPQADSIAQMIEQDVNLRELIADPKAQSVASEETLGELVKKAKASKSETELFRSEIDLFYAAGKNNISLAEVEKMYGAKSLSSDERLAAYYRGLENAQRVYTFKNGNIIEKKMDGSVKGGLLVNDGARRLTNLQKRYLMKLGETLGKTISIQDGLRNGKGQRVSGFINDTAVFIDASVKDPIMWTATHEFSHQMQELAPKEWAKYRDYVISLKKKNGTYDDDLETYEDAYGKISETKLQDEMACDYTDQLFKNEKDLLDFINHSKSLATRVKDIWFKVLDKLNITHKEDARSLWEKCYREASREARKGEDVKSGSEKYKIIMNENISTDEYLKQQMQDWKDGHGKKHGKYNGSYFELGDTPKSLIKHGVSNSKMIMLEECLIKVTGGKHAISTDEIAKLPSQLAEPILLFKSKYKDKKGHYQPAFVALTEMVDIHGNDVVAIVHINKYQDRILVNRIASLYSKTDEKTYENRIENYVSKQIENGNLIDVSNKKAPIWFTSRGLQLPKLVQTIIDANNNVSQDELVVNSHSMQNGGKNSQNGRSRISSAAEATRKNRESDREYEKIRGAIEQLKGKSDGGVVVNEHSIALKKRDITSYVSIQKMSQDLGMKAIIVKGLFEDSEQALDGIITPKGVFIDADAENPARFVATHEFSHRMKQAAVKDWKRYQEYVIKILKEKTLTGSNKTAYDVLYDATRNAYGNKIDDYIHEEIAANHIGELFENEAELIDFIRTDRSLAQKVRAWWNNVLSMFGLNGEVEKVKAMWLRAYKKAVKNVQSGKVGVFSEEARYRVGRTNKNNPVVMLEEDIFKGKEGKPHTIIAEYIAEHIGECYRIIESGQKVYIGEDLPGEFTQSKYTTEFLRKRKKLKNAKDQSIQNFKEVIEIATDRKWEKSTKEKHKIDAKYGFYKYKSMVATPKYDPQKNIVGSNLYEIELLIRNDSNGKKYLYDIQKIVKIKEGDERVSSAWNLKPDSKSSSPTNNNVSQDEPVVNSYSMQNDGNNSRKAVRGTRLSELVEEYGAIEPGAGPRRDVSVPKRTKDDNRVSRFARTAAEATTLSEEVADRVLDGVADGKFSYTPVSNDGALGEANASYDVMGQEWCEREVMGKVQAHNLDKKTIALAEVLLQKYSENGEVEKANELIVEIAAEGTRMGQSIQALSMLKKLSDDYEIKYVDKVIEKLKQDILKRYKGKKRADIVLSNEVRNQIMRARTQEEKNVARERAFEEIANQLPKTWEDKWNAWRYIAMLANTRTHIRNFFGNVFFVPMVTTKNVAGAIFEGVLDQVSSEGIERTKALVVPKEYKEFAKNDLSEVEDILTGGGKNNASSAIQDKQKVFNTKFFEWLRVTNEKLLNKEDLVFLRHHYKNAFAGYLAANKVDLDNIDERTLTRARNYALRQAQMATYRDMNAFSSAVSKLNRVDNKGLRLVIEGVIPFKKTPANILVRGLEYSPAGLVKAMWNGATKLRKGQMTASEFIEELSAGLTGTGVVALGFLLSSLGLIVGAPEDDELKEFEELQGKQSYALVIGDHSYTIDWLAPLALPLFVGVEMQRLFEKRGDLEAKDYYNAITNLAEPMFELSMLSGLSDTISTIGIASSSEMSRSILENTVTGYIGQAVPTLFGQVARVVDDTTRKSYYDKNSAFPKFAQHLAQSQMKKIPGASNMLEPYVDEWGREKVMGNIFGRVLQNFFSPGYYSMIKSSGMEDELKRLFTESNGEYKVFPKKAEKEITLDNGETLMLSAEEYTKMQKGQGKTAYNTLSSIMNDGVYDLLEDDGLKSKLVESIYELSREKAKIEVAGDGYSADAWIEEALSMDENELNDYLVLRTLRNNEFKTDAQARKYASENLDDLSEDFWVSEMSNSRKGNYDEFIKDTGVSAEDYLIMCDYKESLKTINKGQSNEVTPKEQMIDYLNQTGLSVEAKRKIYLSFGWSKKNIPW